MEVNFAPDVQVKIEQLVAETGRTPDQLLEDSLAGYVPELAETRHLLDCRYDDLINGKVKPIGGEAFFESLRRCDDELLNRTRFGVLPQHGSQATRPHVSAAAVCRRGQVSYCLCSAPKAFVGCRLNARTPKPSGDGRYFEGQ